MPSDKVGANLPVVVKPAHLRNDRPPCPLEHPDRIPVGAPVYVELTDGERTFTLPASSVWLVGSEAKMSGISVNVRVEVEP